MPGIVDCAQLVFQKPARIGSVEGCQMNADVDGPEFVNAISLSKYLAKQDMDPNKSFEENKSKNRGSWLQKLWEGIKEFF